MAFLIFHNDDLIFFWLTGINTKVLQINRGYFSKLGNLKIYDIILYYQDCNMNKHYAC